MIVPLFALANAGIEVDGGFLADAFTSPITLGILVGYVVGKPVGILGGSVAADPAEPRAAAAAGGLGGRRRRRDDRRDRLHRRAARRDARLRRDAARGGEARHPQRGPRRGVLTWLLFRATAAAAAATDPRAARERAEPLVDLYLDVDPERDHIRGPRDAPVTVVEYGDFECPYCGMAEPVVRELLRDFGDVRYVWRHLPLNDVHPNAQLAAEASEAAADQGAFWEMHDLLLANQDALQPTT